MLAEATPKPTVIQTALPNPLTSTPRDFVPGNGYPFRFGFGVPTSGVFSQPDIILRMAGRAEALGLDDLWVNDHLNFGRSEISHSPAGTLESVREDSQPNFFESVTSAALLAGRFPRIGVGIGGMVVPLRQPLILAKQIASLHELSGRRLTIAPGIGGWLKDYELSAKPYGRRGRLLDEYMTALYTIFYNEHPVSLSGETLQFQDATLFPRPAGLRVWITGESEPAFNRVIRWGSGYFTSYPTVEAIRERSARLGELAEAAGRDPAALDFAALLFVCIAPTREKALEICMPTIGKRFKSSERALAVSVVGSRAEVLEQLADRYRAGLRYVELRFVCHDTSSYEEMLEETATEVVPSLRQLTP